MVAVDTCQGIANSRPKEPSLEAWKHVALQDEFRETSATPSDPSHLDLKQVFGRKPAPPPTMKGLLGIIEPPT